MTFYIYAKQIGDSIPEQMKRLDEAKARILEDTNCVFSKRSYPNSKRTNDQYTIDISGIAFIDYLDGTISILMREYECEVYW